jgi:hypothetical protein
MRYPLLKYDIVSGTERDFIQKVNDASLRGYDPVGGVCVVLLPDGTPYFYQAVGMQQHEKKQR